MEYSGTAQFCVCQRAADERWKGIRRNDDRWRSVANIILNGGWYFEWSRFDANLMVNYTGPYTNNRFVNPNWVKQNGDFPLGDFVSADLTAGYTFQGKYSKRIFAEIKNILDKKYMTVAGYPEVGRMFLAGVKINLNP